MTTRRSFLRCAALAPLAALTPSIHAAEKRSWIDAHVHVWTPDTEAFPLSEGFSKEKDMVPESFTPNELFAACRPQNVGRIVLIQMSFYKFDNRYMLAMMAKHRGVFGGVAIVDETRSDVHETMKALAAKRVRGFRIYTNPEKAEGWTQSEGMKKMWSYGADAGLAMCLLTGPDSLPAIQRMCAAYPKTRVVIDHFARIGMRGPVDAADVEQLRRLADHPNVYVKTSAFYALGEKKPPYADLGPLIQTLRDTFGAKRLMWASDCPYQLQGVHTYADSVALIRDRLEFLSADDKQWMLRKTAEKVFFS